jgi:Ser/Thr protein kinase RdoA (MazF antagonist)
MKADRPDTSLEAIADLLHAEYNLTGEITLLRGENENYRITLANGRSYVLKLVTARISSEVLELEGEIVAHLQAAGVKLDLPQLVPTQSGEKEASHCAPVCLSSSREHPGL